MRILTRYIIRTVTFTTAIVVLILLGIESFLGLVNELSDIGKGNYDIFQALAYVGMQMPFNLYQMFPIAGFLGGLIGLGQLAQNSELVVMRAAGVSILRIIGALLLAALAMLLVVTVIGETLAPHLQYQSEQMKSRLINPQKTQESISGIWLHHKNTFVYIDKVIASHQLHGITLFEFNSKDQLQNIRMAEDGIYQDGKWKLRNLTITDFTSLWRQGKALPPSLVINQLRLMPTIAVHTLTEAPLGFKFNPQLMQRRMQRDPDQQTIIELIDNIRFRRQAGLLSYNLEFDLWQRFIQPLTTLVMISLGAPFVFGSLRSVSMGGRLLLGIVVGFCFYMINHFLSPIALVHQWPAWIAAIIPTLFFIFIFLVMLRKAR